MFQYFDEVPTVAVHNFFCDLIYAENEEVFNERKRMLFIKLSLLFFLSFFLPFSICSFFSYFIVLFSKQRLALPQAFKAILDTKYPMSKYDLLLSVSESAKRASKKQTVPMFDDEEDTEQKS